MSFGKAFRTSFRCSMTRRARSSAPRASNTWLKEFWSLDPSPPSLWAQTRSTKSRDQSVDRSAKKPVFTRTTSPPLSGVKWASAAPPRTSTTSRKSAKKQSRSIQTTSE